MPVYAQGVLECFVLLMHYLDETQKLATVLSYSLVVRLEEWHGGKCVTVCIAVMMNLVGLETTG